VTGKRKQAKRNKDWAKLLIVEINVAALSQIHPFHRNVLAEKIYKCVIHLKVKLPYCVRHHFRIFILFRNAYLIMKRIDFLLYQIGFEKNLKLYKIQLTMRKKIRFRVYIREERKESENNNMTLL
jgi:hypothetical protein